MTVFSTDLELINTLPGFIETQPLKSYRCEIEDLEVALPLNLPSGVIVVGESTIKVTVSISPIGKQHHTDRTADRNHWEFLRFTKRFSLPIAWILFFPVPCLNWTPLKASDVRILLDLTDKTPGIYQIVPQVQVGNSGILVESILPTTIEVEIRTSPTAVPGS